MFTSWGCFRYLGFAAALTLFGCGGGSSSGPGQTAGSGGVGTSGGHQGGGTSTDAGAPAGGADSTDPVVSDCDDNVLCTLDERVAGECQHTPQHFQCLGGAYCSLTKGCTLGDACASDDDCKRPDSCVTVKCDPKSARCSFHYVDTDGDGEAPLVCGGKDCNDAEFWVHSDAPETCDGLDNDCDGLLDPPKASKCLSTESCIVGKCVCDGGESSCKTGSGADERVCVDLKKDATNCGTCGHACGALEVCSNGACSCDAPLSRCSGSVCHDLTSDAQNCGACGIDCGNATCENGDCACPANTENCGSAQLFDCRDTQTDGSNCGACGESCSAGSGCAKGKCDATVEYVRMYGSDNFNKPTYGATVPLALDTKGNIFAALNRSGDVYELPNGATPAWTGNIGAIAKLDAQAHVVWSVPMGTFVSAIASAGDDLWIAVNASFDLSLAGKDFTRKANHQNMVVLLKLKGSTGEVIDQQQLDLPQSGGGVWLTADTDGAWVAFDVTGNVSHGADTFTQPEGYYTLLYATSSGATRWLPGFPSQLTLDPNKKVFVAVNVDGGVDITFGGASFSPTRRFGQWAFARYSKALVHDASWLMPADFEANAATPDKASVFWTNGTGRTLQENDYAGALVGTASPSSPMNLFWAEVLGDKLYATGSTTLAGGEVDGRTLPGYQALFTKFDKATKKLENSFALNTDKNPDTAGSISGMVVTDNGAAAVLSVGFDDAISFTGGNTYDVTGKSGIAFIKVKLTAP